MLVGRGHDQRAEGPHFLMEQSDSIVLGVVRPEAVGANHLGEAVGFVRRGHVPTPAHFAKPDFQACVGQLPRGLRSGQPAADDVNPMRHAGVR